MVWEWGSGGGLGRSEGSVGSVRNRRSAFKGGHGKLRRLVYGQPLPEEGIGCLLEPQYTNEVMAIRVSFVGSVIMAPAGLTSDETST